MIREIIKRPHNKYGRFFLSMEAPGDEETPKKGNTKVIDVKPNNRKRLDFTAGAEEPDDDNDNDEETPDDNDYTTVEDDGGADTDTTTDTATDTADGGDTTDTEGDTTTPADSGETTGEEETTNDADGITDTATDDTTNDGTEGGEETTDNTGEETGGDIEADTGDDTDYSDGSDESGEDTTSTDTSTDSGGTENDKKGPGLEYDSTRKYILFENYISLNNALLNYISKLENIISDDFEMNKVLKTTISKLTEIRELCESFMMMKFEASGYIQSLLFYQNLIVMVQLVLDTFGKARKNTSK